MDPGPPGSGSLNHQAILRKTVISTVLWLLYDFLSLKTDINVPSNSKKQENFRIRICNSDVRIRGSLSGSLPKCHGSTTLTTFSISSKLFAAFWKSFNKETISMRIQVCESYESLPPPPQKKCPDATRPKFQPCLTFRTFYLRCCER